MTERIVGTAGSPDDAQSPAGAVQARVSDVTGGQIAVGNRVVQISAEHGSVVIAGDDEPLQVTPRPLPIDRGPRTPKRVVGREQELARIFGYLERGLSVELAGPPGVGRTTVLGATCGHDPPSSTPDGVVAAPAGLPPEDVLQFIFDACFQRSRRVKPTAEEVRRYLHDCRILVVLDDTDLTRPQIERIQEALPSAVFAMTVDEPLLIGDDATVTLAGLSGESAVVLLEQAMGRPIGPEEEQAALRLVEGLAGMPLQVLQLAAVVADRGLSLVTVADEIAPTVEDPQEALTLAATDGLDPREREALVAVAAFGGQVGSELVGAFLEDPRAADLLIRLRGRGLVSGDDLAGWTSVAAAGADGADRSRAAAVLSAWLTEPDRRARDVAAQAPVVMSVLRQEESDGRDDEIIRLASIAESRLALAGHWGMWRQVLEQGLAASLRTNDRASATFFQHQLDVRASSVGLDTTTTREHLARALREPEALYRPDTRAMPTVDRTRTLPPVTAPELLRPAVGHDRPEPRRPQRGRRRPAWVPILVLLILGVAAALFAAVALRQESQPPTPTPTVTLQTPSQTPRNSQPPPTRPSPTPSEPTSAPPSTPTPTTTTTESTPADEGVGQVRPSEVVEDLAP